jgi:hypothetical protein
MSQPAIEAAEPSAAEHAAGLEDDYRATSQTWERVIRDYNLKDLAI